MDIGMLWFDDDKQRTLEDKIDRGAYYYSEKYGQRPNTCYVNPRELGNTVIEQHARQVIVPGILVKMNGTVLKNHFWYGIEQRQAPVAQASEPDHGQPSGTTGAAQPAADVHPSS